MRRSEMEKYVNPYLRLQLYSGLLVNDYATLSIDEDYNQGLPIKRLHEITGIPLNVIREDIVIMLKWQSRCSIVQADLKLTDSVLGYILEFDFDFLNEEDCTWLSKIEELYDRLMEDGFPDELETMFIKGELDEVPLYIENNGMFHVPLTVDEWKALNFYKAKESAWNQESVKFKKNYSDTYVIKDSYLFHYNYDNLLKKLELINRAISNKYYLTANYKTAKSKMIEIKFMPVKISYDSTENLYYVLCVYKEKIMAYRLDHILTLKIFSRSESEEEVYDESLFDIYLNVWGCCFSESPEQVKIKFYNEANVWNKVKRDLECRTNGKLYEKDGYLYYEDVVYGIHKLRSWIYGFGSSTIVIEPQSLRESIIASLKERRTCM